MELYHISICFQRRVCVKLRGVIEKQGQIQSHVFLSTQSSGRKRPFLERRRDTFLYTS
jgi:uncharacterized protein (DUF2141 family)